MLLHVPRSVVGVFINRMNYLCQYKISNASGSMCCWSGCRGAFGLFISYRVCILKLECILYHCCCCRCCCHLLPSSPWAFRSIVYIHLLYCGDKILERSPCGFITRHEGHLYWIIVIDYGRRNPFANSLKKGFKWIIRALVVTPHCPSSLLLVHRKCYRQTH